MAELVVRFLLTGEVTEAGAEAGAGSTSMASTKTKLTWDWVLSDLSPTTGAGLGTNIDN